MKKLLFMLLITLATTQNAKCQEVYKEILRLSTNVANDKSKGLQNRKIATFKVDALNYMAMKMNEVMPDSTVRTLDVEAYALYDFVNLYINKISEAKTKKAKADIIGLFKSASLQNPRFNDMDLDLVEAYIKNEGYLTKFSLDTNWSKALEQARTELRKRGL